MSPLVSKAGNTSTTSAPVSYTHLDVYKRQALVSLQSHSEARKTLNSARKLMPGEHQVWILAAQLEERGAGAPLHKLVNLLTKGIKELIKNGRTLTINDWLFEAERIEEEASALYPNTIAALVKASMSLEFDIESDDAVRELSLIHI